VSLLPSEWLQALQPLLAPAPLAVLGLLVGSFLNVVVHRLPLMMERQWWGDVAGQLADRDSFRRVFAAEAPAGVSQSAAALESAVERLAPLSLLRPPSRCPACGWRIRWFENVPVVSWLWLRGRCSACGTPIRARYPLVEAGTALLFGMAGWRFAGQGFALAVAAVLAVLLVLALIDWDTTVLPDSLTLPLLWAGLASAAAGWTPALPLSSAMWGAVVGYGSLWAVYWLFKLVTGKEGMGHGDFKLLGALGAWLGPAAVLPIVLFASVIGAVVGLGMKATGSLREGRFVPFGPFLAGGGAVVLLVGAGEVLSWIGWGSMP
jgi:leader peptidase (prepilin peptidase)/N-methyltransferase